MPFATIPTGRMATTPARRARCRPRRCSMASPPVAARWPYSRRRQRASWPTNCSTRDWRRRSRPTPTITFTSGTRRVTITPHRVWNASRPRCWPSMRPTMSATRRRRASWSARSSACPVAGFILFRRARRRADTAPPAWRNSGKASCKSSWLQFRAGRCSRAAARLRHRRSLQQLDGDALGSAEKGDARSRANGLRTAGKGGALGLEFGAGCIDVGHLQSEVIETLVGMAGTRHGPGVLADVQDEDIGAAEFEVDARLALRQAADHFGPEHALVEGGRRFGVAAEEVDVVEGELGHRASLMRLRHRLSALEC